MAKQIGGFSFRRRGVSVAPAACGEHSMWRPRAPRRVAQAGALCAIGAAAAFAVLNGNEAFTGIRMSRPAGQFIVTDTPPEGMVCRPAYGDRSGREEWNPLPQWRGEKSYHANKQLQADENRQWYHFDAEGKVLGHLAQAIMNVLRGKDSPLYDPIRDVGGFVVVTNCEKVRVSGKKYHYKLYLRNLSFRPGHLKVERFKDLQKRFPERIVMRSVWGCMPKTPSCRRIFKERLKLFTGPNHLYYHMDPVEYPMHLVKDCTHEQNLKKKLRIKYFSDKVGPNLVRNQQIKEMKNQKKSLALFKEFLAKQYETTGAEQAERMEFDEFVYRAERERIDKVLEDNEGKPLPAKEQAFYPGTLIPKKRISHNYKR